MGQEPSNLFVATCISFPDSECDLRMSIIYICGVWFAEIERPLSSFMWPSVENLALRHLGLNCQYS
jgi:hypothetical protein